MDYSEKSDVYALGMCLFILCTGCFPYSIDDGEIRRGRFNKRIKWDMVKRQSPKLQEMLRGMLDFNPESRWDLYKVIENIDELREAFRKGKFILP